MLKVHHIGYLVKNHKRGRDAILALGYKSVTEPVFDELRGVNISFVEKDGYVVELISPETKDSVVCGLHKKIGNSPYHICYSTDDFDGEIERLTKSGYVMFEEPKPAVAFENKRVCFLVHPFLGMIAILDTEDD